MVAVAPLRALRYAPGTDLAALTSPPHDCIPAGELDALRARSPDNIVHLILPEARPGDAEPPGTPNRFARVADHLGRMMRDGTLQRDQRSAYYLYEATHRPGPDAGGEGEPVTMRALVARLRVDPTYTHVRRHEKTLVRKKRDRLSLREATETDLEPIWLLYRDERGWVEEILRSNAFESLARLTDEAGVEHQLWRVDRPEAVEEITAQFDDRTLVIADGHHRYQTAIDHAAATGKPEHESILVCLVRDNDPGIRIEATHRLVHGLADASTAALLGAAGAQWSARPVAAPALGDVDGWNAVLAQLGQGRVALVTRGASGLELHLLTATTPPADASRLAALTVTLVQERLLVPWGAPSAEDHLSFTRDAAGAAQAVAQGEEDAALLLPPEDVHSVLEVAQEGHLMPQKSTYFVPKLRSGLVLLPLDSPPPQGWKERAGDPGPARFQKPPLS